MNEVLKSDRHVYKITSEQTGNQQFFDVTEAITALQEETCVTVEQARMLYDLTHIQHRYIGIIIEDLTGRRPQVIMGGFEEPANVAGMYDQCKARFDKRMAEFVRVNAPANRALFTMPDGEARLTRALQSIYALRNICTYLSDACSGSTTTDPRVGEKVLAHIFGIPAFAIRYFREFGLLDENSIGPNIYYARRSLSGQEDFFKSITRLTLTPHHENATPV